MGRKREGKRWWEKNERTRVTEVGYQDGGHKQHTLQLENGARKPHCNIHDYKKKKKKRKMRKKGKINRKMKEKKEGRKRWSWEKIRRRKEIEKVEEKRDRQKDEREEEYIRREK